MTTPLALNERQHAVRQRLHQQRELIAQQLQTNVSAPALYPRSMTMRFLTTPPPVAVQMLTQVVSLLLGARLLRTLNTALVVAQMARGLSQQRRLRLLRQASDAEV
ncbi:MAG: hypothetical protein CFE49_02530 [Pseudomonas sp. PGPPP3]|nr:MAG: hypothetical protein CFE49_02530 [Pseudomonas sp. PGPPP3]